MKVRMHQIASSARCSITMVTSKIPYKIFRVQTSGKVLESIRQFNFFRLNKSYKIPSHETKDHLMKFLYEKKFLREEIRNWF